MYLKFPQAEFGSFVVVFCFLSGAVKAFTNMALSGVYKDRGELRIHESLDELSTDLADYIADLSEASVKERGVFAIALSGGSLIGLMGYQHLPFSMLGFSIL